MRRDLQDMFDLNNKAQREQVKKKRNWYVDCGGGGPLGGVKQAAGLNLGMTCNQENRNITESCPVVKLHLN